MPVNRRKNPYQKRIALMIPTLEGGGAERTFINLAGGFQGAGYQVDIILKQATGEFLSQVPQGINLINLNAPRMARTLPGLVSYLREFRPRALLAGLELPNLLAIMAKGISRSPSKVIVTIHSVFSQGERFFLPHRSLEKMLMKLLYPWADQIVAVSRGAAQDFSSYLGIPLSKIRTIYNPVVSPELLEKAQQPMGHPWLEPGQPPVILGVGRLEPVKDYPALIRAFSRVRQHIPVRLLILGEGAQREALESLILQLGLREDVSLPGFQENPYAFMSAAAMLASASQHESFGRVLIEAMACGCPVVTTDCPGGARELVNAGEYGHLVPLGDEAALARAILNVLGGDVRKPPPEWLRQFEAENVLQQYLDII